MKKIKQIVSISVLLFMALVVVIPNNAFAAAPSLVWSRSLPGIAIRESSPMPINYDASTTDITFGARNSKLYVLDGDNGLDKTNWPQSTSNAIDATPSSGDVDGDGNLDIFITSGVSDQGQCSGGGLFRFSKTGNKILEFNAIDDAGESNIQCADPAIHSSPVLGDINKDGATDIAFGALGLKNWNVRYDGAINNGWPYYWDDTQFASAALADVNSDSKTDIIIGGDSSPGVPVDHRGGMVRAFNGDGSQIWEYRVNEIVRSSPSVGDVDGDGNLDVVFGTGNYWVNNGGASDATKIFVLNASNGALKWSKDLGAQTLASPTLADFSGDGRLDIGIASWEGSDPGKLWLMDGVSGTNLSGFPVASGGGVVLGQITTADLNADGKQDPIVSTGGAIFAYNAANGSQLWGLRQGVASYQNSPLVKDLDSDGRLDIVIAGTKPNGEGIIDRYEFGGGDPAVLGSNGWHMFRKDERLTGSWASTLLSDTPSGASGLGYRMFTSSGGTYQFGSSPFSGSLVGITLAKPIVNGSAKAGSTNGYWMVASDGGIFSFGDAGFHGSTGAITLNKPIVGMASTPSGNGYWMVASDGGIFSFGDAGFHGSTGAITLNKPIVGMAKTSSGAGYWLVASDGGIFAFGDAPFHGSTGNINLVKPIVGMTRAPGNGYWMVASDGGIFSFNAAFYGSSANTYGNSIVGVSTQGGN